MDMKKSKKLLAYLAVAYWALVIMIYLVAHPQFRYTNVVSDSLSASMTIGEVVDGMEIKQMVTVPANEMRTISLMTATYGRQNQGVLTLTLSDAQGIHLAEQTVNASAFEDNKYTMVNLSEPVVGRKGENLLLTISAQGCVPGNALTIYAGNTVTTGRFDIVQNISEAERYRVNGQMGVGRLCVKLSGVDALSFYKTYWLLVTGAFAVLAALGMRWWKQAKQNKNNPLVSLCTLYSRYGFLLSQLVSREFNKKYKRSVLGVVWSFLNPLLTMFVQYIVFSKLFKSNIPNYPVYLLTGIVFMQFFTNAVSLGMSSITGNAALIKKVYMPKYVYPLSRIISALINFLISLIPLLLVILVTGTTLRFSLLLLVFDILCLLGFVTGMVMLATTAMTFFQDTQFIWGVLSMMWMYLTPVFYPETIIPEKILTFYHANPMYQYITFARICILDGVSPEPMAYLWCVLSSVTVLILGLWSFKKKQDEFVLYV